MKIYNFDSCVNTKDFEDTLDTLFKATFKAAYCDNSLGSGKYLIYCRDGFGCAHCILAKRVIKTRNYYETF